MNNSQNVYKNAFGTALLMTDTEVVTFCNGIVAALGLPVGAFTPGAGMSARRMVVHLLDELAEQGKTATVGVDGCAVIHRLESAVFAAPDDLSRDRKPKNEIARGMRYAISIIRRHVSDTATISESETDFAKQLADKIYHADLSQAPA